MALLRAQKDGRMDMVKLTNVQTLLQIMNVTNIYWY